MEKLRPQDEALAYAMLPHTVKDCRVMFELYASYFNGIHSSGNQELIDRMDKTLFHLRYRMTKLAQASGEMHDPESVQFVIVYECHFPNMVYKAKLTNERLIRDSFAALVNEPLPDLSESKDTTCSFDLDSDKDNESTTEEEVSVVIENSASQAAVDTAKYQVVFKKARKYKRKNKSSKSVKKDVPTIESVEVEKSPIKVETKVDQAEHVVHPPPGIKTVSRASRFQDPPVLLTKQAFDVISNIELCAERNSAFVGPPPPTLWNYSMANGFLSGQYDGRALRLLNAFGVETVAYKDFILYAINDTPVLNPEPPDKLEYLSGLALGRQALRAFA